LVEHRASGVREAILRQITDRQCGRFEDGAGIGLIQTGHHPKERRLAGTVRTAQAHTLTVGDLPGDVVEQHTVSEGLREVLKLDHVAAKRVIVADGSAYSPKAFAAAASTCGTRNGLVR